MLTVNLKGEGRVSSVDKLRDTFARDTGKEQSLENSVSAG